MATSSKVKWKLEALCEAALTAIDDQIAAKVLEIERHDQGGGHAEELKEWRNNAEVALTNQASRLRTTDDYQLSQFKLPPMPKRDGYQRERMERELQTMQARRSKIVAKATSLVPDEEGNIQLTKTQLSEFFDL